jgi:hypothetical protein
MRKERLTEAEGALNGGGEKPNALQKERRSKAKKNRKDCNETRNERGTKAKERRRKNEGERTKAKERTPNNSRPTPAA